MNSSEGSRQSLTESITEIELKTTHSRMGFLCQGYVKYNRVERVQG